MVRTTFFAPDEVSALSKAEKDAAAAGKLLVECASASGVGHFAVNTAGDETRTGTSTEVVVGATESAAVVEAKVGKAAVETGTGTSTEVGIEAAECAAVVESAVGTAAVKT